MRALIVNRVVRGEIAHVGFILASRSEAPVFGYAPEYLESPFAMELSCSLPLRSEVFVERQFQPYFEGLLPEGEPRRALAQAHGAREDDYLTLLAIVGLDCIGDVLIFEADLGDAENDGMRAVAQVKGIFERFSKQAYEPISLKDIDEAFRSTAMVAKTASRSRLSLTGTQQKVGFAHKPEAPLSEGWLRPLDGAASTHILKTAESQRYVDLELVCLGAASRLGIEVAKTSGLSLPRTVLVSERFDREIAGVREDGSPIVNRLHQEDLNQAFGLAVGSKYFELEGGSYRAIASLLRERSVSVANDLDQLARVAVYNYLVGNCDNHLKNLSVLHVGPRGLKLAPAYDILCTTIFEDAPGVPKWRRELGMRIGNAETIDEVAAEDFELLADDLGIGRRAVARICAEIGESAVDALLNAGEEFADVSEAIPYDAEDLVEEMEPRLAVVRAAGARR